jgi:hypothetical protein
MKTSALSSKILDFLVTMAIKTPSCWVTMTIKLQIGSIKNGPRGLGVGDG